MQKRSFFIYLSILVFGITIAWTYRTFQPPNKYELSPLADANEYKKIYSYFKGDSRTYNIRFGIHNRIFIPFVASILPVEQASDSFFFVNTSFALLSLLVMYYLMRIYSIPVRFSLLALVYFSVHWVGSFRQNAIDPINVDMAVYFFEAVFFILLIKRQYLFLLLLTPIAIATKELFLALLIALLAISLLWKYLFKDKSLSIPWMVGIVIFGIITKLALNYLYPSTSPGRNSMIVMAFHLREMVYHPDHMLRWFLSLFAAFGAFLFLAIKRIRNIKSIEKNILIIHLLSLSVLALSFLGGMDYTRLIFLGFPFVIISILKISAPTPAYLFLAFFLSLMLTRFWKIIPVLEFDLSPYNAWMPEVSDSTWMMIWFFGAFAYFVIMFTGKKIMNSTASSHPLPE